MASPYILTNADLQYLNSSGQSFQIFLAFLNPVSVQTNWVELGQDSSGNWLPPANYDTAAKRVQPYAPTANLGSNRIGFVNEPLYFDGSRSCQRFDLPVIPYSYVWSVSGPSFETLYANGAQLEVVWASPGLYTVSLTVSDRAGTTTTGTRQVMIYQDRDNALPGVLAISGLSGSLSSGGWQMQCTTVSTQWTLSPPDSLAPGTYQPVVVLAETAWEVQPDVWVDATVGPHGLFNPGYPYQDPRILFDGYVQQGSLHQDPDKDTLSFTCVGPQLLMQEAKTHQLGYYNCSYTSIVNGVPVACNPSAAGSGYQVGNLTSADVIHSLLQTHSTIGLYHDLHIWNANIPTAPYQAGSMGASYNLIYTSLSVNEGTVWSNIGDIAANEWAQVYCERDGSLRVGPQTNERGVDYWQQPTLLGPSVAPALINVVADLGFTVGTDDPLQMTEALPQMPAQPFPVLFVHPWGHHQNPPQFLAAFSQGVDPSVSSTQAGLTGPPVLCTFSDIPVYDPSSTPPRSSALYPWITNNWPQDLSVYPLFYDITPIYTGRAALVKLIGTLQGHNTVWTSWDPLSAFQVQSTGASLEVSVLPASDWVLDESHVLPDVTTNQNANLVWNWWWEMARRMRAARNTSYSCQVTLGIFTAASLGDVVAVNRQNVTLGPTWAGKLFFVQQIDHALDLTSRTWQTSLSLSEVTSNGLGPIVAPPTSPPKG